MRRLIYHDQPGTPSPRGYISELPAADRANVDHRFGVIRDFDIPDWPRSWVKKLEDKIWQLKSKSTRILYFLHDDAIIVVHAFRKRTLKTRRKHIDLALSRLDDYLGLQETKEN